MKQYTITQAAGLLKKSPRTVRQNVEKYPDIGHRVGSIWILSDADLTKLAALRRGPKPRARRAKAPAAQPSPAGAPAAQGQEP